MVFRALDDLAGPIRMLRCLIPYMPSTASFSACEYFQRLEILGLSLGQSVIKSGRVFRPILGTQNSLLAAIDNFPEYGEMLSFG